MEAATFAQQTARVLANEQLAERTFRLRLEAPEVASRLRPGQFLMVRPVGSTDPLLGRPFAFWDTHDDAGRPAAVDVVHLVVGKVTSRLAALRPGERVEVWGPLGHGFPDVPERPTVALVAGGIGQTPFPAVARQLLGLRGYAGEPPRRRADRVLLYYGVRTATLAAGLDDFRTLGVEVRIATDDGSLGERGLVTQLVELDRPDAHLFGCGPVPMLRALGEYARGRGLPCHVSLETPMACGVGVCFSCVTPVKAGDGWDYRRVCVDGPVFNAGGLLWDVPPA
jgi:dihydroorotate dehydrogenase electron transfer subunit